MQDHFQIFHLPISQYGILYCFGQETILHSVRCVRRKVLEPEKDVEGVIYVGRWWKLKNSASSDTHSFQSTRVYYIMYSLNYTEY